LDEWGVGESFIREFKKGPEKNTRREAKVRAFLTVLVVANFASHQHNS
jgi:hypothetical protein